MTLLWTGALQNSQDIVISVASCCLVYYPEVESHLSLPGHVCRVLKQLAVQGRFRADRSPLLDIDIERNLLLFLTDSTAAVVSG